MTTSQIFKLSASKLSLFLECPLCFWLENVKGIHRPSGAFPSLPGGMDIALKKYYDEFRQAGKLPPELIGKVDGKLLDDNGLIKRLRNWRSFNFQDEKLNVIFYGALDDCLVWKDRYIPLDFKTRGFDLKEDSTKIYQNQLDCYALMLERNGYKHPGFAYLVYYIPKEIKENGRVEFAVQVKKMQVDSGRALKTMKKALEILKGKKPKAHSDCKFCSWGNDYAEGVERED